MPTGGLHQGLVGVSPYGDPTGLTDGDHMSFPAHGTGLHKYQNRQESEGSSEAQLGGCRINLPTFVLSLEVRYVLFRARETGAAA